MSIKDLFKEKHIFITGGSGFIGKVLIEKLLRSCGGIKQIYVLLRKKGDQTPEEKLKIITDCYLFDKLRAVNPSALNKLVPISGDVEKLQLALSEEDRKILIENVDIIYHSAASVRFDDHLKDSILLNTRGTKEVVDIALEAKKLVTFVHISTAYCNVDKTNVKEELYPAPVDWRKAIALAEQLDQHTFNILSTKYISPLPNTYTFAKCLSEHIVNDLCKDKLPAAIVRPSVVVPTFDDPFSGFVESFNGPIGLLSAGGKGLLKVCYGDENVKLDYIPVDSVIKMLILVTYEKLLSRDLGVSVYNAAFGEKAAVSTKQLIAAGSKLTWDVPYKNLMWYPSFSIFNNFYIYFITFILYHMLPAVFVDALLKLSGKKTMLIKIQRKIYIANLALLYFMQNTVKFANDKSIALLKYITESEMQTFSFVHYIDFTKEEMYLFYMKSKIGTASALFKEKFDRKGAFRNTMILWVLNSLLHTGFFCFLFWYLLTEAQILNIFGSMMNRYLHYLKEL